MPGENFLKTAAYFEDRARRSRRPEDKDRFLAVAKKDRARAEEIRRHNLTLSSSDRRPVGNESPLRPASDEGRGKAPALGEPGPPASVL
jgi:hypothetical protein